MMNGHCTCTCTCTCTLVVVHVFALIHAHMFTVCMYARVRIAKQGKIMQPKPFCLHIPVPLKLSQTTYPDNIRFICKLKSYSNYFTSVNNYNFFYKRTSYYFSNKTTNYLSSQLLPRYRRMINRLV